MKTLRDLILAIFVSPEFTIAVVCILLYEVAPSSFQFVGESLSVRDEAFKWLSLVPAGVLVFTLRCARDTLLPRAERAEVLAGWPDFYILKNRVLVGLFYVFATTCTTIGIWISGANIARASLSGIYSTAFGINLTAAATVWYASVQVGIRLRRANVQET